MNIQYVLFSLLAIISTKATASLTPSEEARNVLIDSFASGVVVAVNGTAGERIEATCPMGKVISLGWTYHFNGEGQGKQSTCEIFNSKACRVGATSCAVEVCNPIRVAANPTVDTRGVIIVCVDSIVPGLEATYTSGDAITQVQSVTCPIGKSILFNFGYQYGGIYKSTTGSGPPHYNYYCTEKNMAVPNHNLFPNLECQLSNTTCNTHACESNAGNPLRFKYALCANSTFVENLVADGTLLLSSLGVYEEEVAGAVSPVLQGTCPEEVPTLVTGVKYGLSQLFNGDERIVELNGACSFKANNAIALNETESTGCVQQPLNEGTYAQQFIIRLCAKQRAQAQVTMPPTDPVAITNPPVEPTDNPTDTTTDGPTNTGTRGPVNGESLDLTTMLIGLGVALGVSAGFGVVLLRSSSKANKQANRLSDVPVVKSPRRRKYTRAPSGSMSSMSASTTQGSSFFGRISGKLPGGKGGAVMIRPMSRFRSGLLSIGRRGPSIPTQDALAYGEANPQPPPPSLPSGASKLGSGMAIAAVATTKNSASHSKLKKPSSSEKRHKHHHKHHHRNKSRHRHKEHHHKDGLSGDSRHTRHKKHTRRAQERPIAPRDEIVSITSDMV